MLVAVSALVVGNAHANGNQVDFILGASTQEPRQFLRNGEAMWAIVTDGSGHRVEKRLARVEMFKYRNPARGDGIFTGQRLVGPGADQALMHLAGSLKLHEGPVILEPSGQILIDHSFGQDLTPSRPLTFRLGDRVFRLVAESVPVDRGYRSLRVVLEEGETRQELVSAGETTDPFARVAWIGDIDRDGLPDFLLSVRFHHSETSHRLFLSTFAKAGQLTRHVGTLDEFND